MERTPWLFTFNTRDEIAIVLTDMMMPVMDGAATIQALLRINPAVKIIAASGLTANGGAVKESGAGDQTLPHETLYS